MNLREHLKEILPSILPRSAAESIKGTELIKMVKMRLIQPYSDATLRYHFSVMSCDPTSPIAKVDQGQGYYLRGYGPAPAREFQPRLDQRLLAFDPGEPAQEYEDLWEKFQAFFERFANHQAARVFPIRRDPAADASERPWLAPDAVVVHWKGVDSFDGVRLRPELLCAEPVPFTIASVKLALRLDASNYRRVFYQCLSAGAWAHVRELAIATEVLDESLVDDLRRLGRRHGVGVSFFRFSEDRLAAWAEAEELRSLPAEEFDQRLRENAECHRVVAPEPSLSLDWEHIEQLQGALPELPNLFRWLHHCLAKRELCHFAEFARLPESAS